ncbi:MAG: hypothetical protein H7061_11725, partial [Bdellovibrionaceae bacterium]|nr:hypothetical protein [Bdellovibrio sp.]
MKQTLLLLSTFVLLSCSTFSKRYADGTPKKERLPASQLEIRFFPGEMSVKGNLALQLAQDEQKKNLQLLKNRKVTVSIVSPSAAYSPMKRLRGDKNLIIRMVADQENHDQSEFVFEIPKEGISDDGSISVNKDAAHQEAHLKVARIRRTEKSEQVNSAQTCGMIGAQGTKIQVYNYKTKLVIKMYNESGSAEIVTSEYDETESLPAVPSSECS